MLLTLITMACVAVVLVAAAVEIAKRIDRDDK